MVITKLEKPLKREILLGREPWVVTLTPAGLKMTRKGHRLGVELPWAWLVSGDAALAVALNASLQRPRRVRSPEPLRAAHAAPPRVTRRARGAAASAADRSSGRRRAP